MSFKTPQEFDIQDNHPRNEQQIVELDKPEAPEVEDYEFRPFRAGPRGLPEGTPVTRPGTSGERRDARFSINPFARDAVTMREEDQREFDRRVQERLQQLVESERKKAAEKGYQAGLEKGRQEAYGAFRQEASERLARFESFVSECESAKESIFKANERFLMELIYRICRMLFLNEVKVDQQYLSRLARELIDRVGVRENILIRVNPQDMETIEMLKETLAKNMGGLKNLNIESSEQVQGGGCTVETQWNSIDASIETQLQGIHQALIGEGGAK